MITQTESPPTAALLTDTQLAVQLSVSRRKIHSMKSAGQLPLEVRLGRCVRWRLTDIALWVALGCPAREKFDDLKAGA